MSYLIMISFAIAGFIWFITDIINFVKKKFFKKKEDK